MPDIPRTALITGASRGIGKAIAIRLANAGHRVGINYKKHRSEAEEIVGTIRSNGGTAIAVGGDVGDRNEAQNLVDQTEAQIGSIEILVNNAGIISDGLLVRMKDEDFERVLQTNLMGTYYMCRIVSPTMLKNRWGRIINISSIVGSRGNAGQTNYAASKGAVNMLTKSLAKELAGRNITVNVVSPGYTETATVSDLSARLKEAILGRIPAGRFGTTDEIAALAAFLASDDARYITGDIIRADGGLAI